MYLSVDPLGVDRSGRTLVTRYLARGKPTNERRRLLKNQASPGGAKGAVARIFRRLLISAGCVIISSSLRELTRKRPKSRFSKVCETGMPVARSQSAGDFTLADKNFVRPSDFSQLVRTVPAATPRLLRG